MGLGFLQNADAWVFGWLFWGGLFWLFFEEEGFICLFPLFLLLDSIFIHIMQTK